MSIRGSLLAISASVLMVAALAVGALAQEKGEEPKEEKQGPVKARIRLAPGGRVLPLDIKKMRETAKEMQELQQQYKKTIEDLVEAARNLENTNNLMAEIPKITKLVKDVDVLKD